jgi:hypothetical protein
MVPQLRIFMSSRRHDRHGLYDNPRTLCAATRGACSMSMLDMSLVAGVLLLAVLIVARKKR